MQEEYPVYYPRQGRWECLGKKGKTLEELQLQLPDVKFMNYYPLHDGRRVEIQRSSPVPRQKPGYGLGKWDAARRHRWNARKPRLVQPSAPSMLPLEKLPRKPRSVPAVLVAWTPEEDTNLKQLKADGYTFGQIALSGGFRGRSRNALIGRWKRIGMAHPYKKSGYQLRSRDTGLQTTMYLPDPIRRDTVSEDSPRSPQSQSEPTI